MLNIVTRFGIIDAENQINLLLLTEQQIEELRKSSESTQEDIEHQSQWISYLHEEIEGLKKDKASLREDNEQLRDEVREIKVVTGKNLSEIFSR